MAKFAKKIEIAELCKGVHCVDLGESFQTHIFLQNLASIQPRTSLVKFDHLAEKSECRICPRRAGELYKARSRLYRSQNLQNKYSGEALAGMYTIIHSCAHLESNLRTVISEFGKQHPGEKQSTSSPISFVLSKFANGLGLGLI